METQIGSTEIILEEFETDKLPTLEELMAELEREETIGGLYVVELADGSPPKPSAAPPASKAALGKLTEENQKLNDALTRSQADFENFRRRIERERGDNYAFALTSIVKELLPVLDNFRLALANAENLAAADLQNYFDGFDLIRLQMEKVLQKLGVKLIPAVGEAFNPHVHEAVATEPNSEVAPNTILEEIQCGYQLGKRLIRPAMVKVSTGIE